MRDSSVNYLKRRGLPGSELLSALASCHWLALTLCCMVVVAEREVTHMRHIVTGGRTFCGHIDA
jgi:hypothetical protein